MKNSNLLHIENHMSDFGIDFYSRNNEFKQCSNQLEKRYLNINEYLSSIDRLVSASPINTKNVHAKKSSEALSKSPLLGNVYEA